MTSWSKLPSTFNFSGRKFYANSKYIYIYIYRERERERESYIGFPVVVKTLLNFIKSLYKILEIDFIFGLERVKMTIV